MEGKKKDDEKNNSNDFDYKKELETLIQKKVLPSKIANKLKEKIENKNIQPTKNQLNSLVNKIKNILENYSSKKEKITLDKTNLNTPPKNLMQTIEKLEKRLENLETNLLDEEGSVSSDQIVKTDDIKVSEKEYKGGKIINVDPLAKVPGDPESVIVLMKWLQFLVDRCGRSHLPEILDYYVDVGWISEDAKIVLLDYSNGIKEEKGDTEDKKISDLPSTDHIQSLVFIQKLKGRKFDKHFLDKIDSELSRMTKKIDNHNLK